MALLLVFAFTLLAAVLLSELAHRSILSTAALFLGAGLLFGITGVVEVDPRDDAIVYLVEITLFTVLYTDAMRVGVRDLVQAWRLPGRALLLGMPLVFAGTAALAWLLLDVTWGEAFLLGAVLAPTDPVLANAIIGREAVPARLRYLLGVESGLNDGLALPAVLLILAALGSSSDATALVVLEELGLGVAIGVAIPWVVVRVVRIRGVGAAAAYEELLGFAIGIVVFAVASATHGNLFLAAFAAGVTIRTTGPEVRETFERFGEIVAELLKLLGLLLFAAAIPPSEWELPVAAWVLALLVLVAVRPAAMEVALVASPLDRSEKLTMEWFGPKGFASVLYGLLVLQSGIPNAEFLFTVVAAVILVSIVAHSSTDVLVAGFFKRQADRAGSREEARARGPREVEAERHAEKVAYHEAELQRLRRDGDGE